MMLPDCRYRNCPLARRPQDRYLRHRYLHLPILNRPILWKESGLSLGGEGYAPELSLEKSGGILGKGEGYAPELSFGKSGGIPGGGECYALRLSFEKSGGILGEPPSNTQPSVLGGHVQRRCSVLGSCLSTTLNMVIERINNAEHGVVVLGGVRGVREKTRSWIDAPCWDNDVEEETNNVPRVVEQVCPGCCLRIDGS